MATTFVYWFVLGVCVSLTLGDGGNVIILPFDII